MSIESRLNEIDQEADRRWRRVEDPLMRSVKALVAVARAAEKAAGALKLGEEFGHHAMCEDDMGEGCDCGLDVRQDSYDALRAALRALESGGEK